jgi:calcineurin-like phosphoesterase family protein
MNIWFTSDHHFGHKRIIELANRPFESVEAMDEEMIARWNDKVSKGDMVYHLGDFAFADHTPYLIRLNGQKRLILGNHDHSNRVNKAKGWATVDSLLHITLPDKTPVVLCHYAMRVWSRSHHGAIHLYGHSHGNLTGDRQCCDVGVDCWNFEPVSIEDIRERLWLNDLREEPDHHGTTPAFVHETSK